jgi:hypothetical protein
MRRVKIVFEAPTGRWEWNGSGTIALSELKREAMIHFNLDPLEADKFLLACDGERLDESASARQMSIPATTVITVWRMGGPARTSPLNAHRPTSSMYTRF